MRKWVYALPLLLSLIMLLVGVVRRASSLDDWGFLAAGAIGVILSALVWPLAISIESLAKNACANSEELTGRLAERLDQMSILLNMMSDQQLISDRAKQVAFREKDKEAMRRAIQEDLAKGDWDAAAAMAEDMEQAFGYHGEAERVRTDINNRRSDMMRRQFTDVMNTIDRHTRAEQWTAAMREAERVMAQFPDNEQFKALPAEIENRRQAHKRNLLSSWNEAVQRHDVEGSIEILKQLDAYLTPAEAEGMQETCRNIFKERLTNLQKQFTQSVTDHKWAEAIELGETIMREFPNTRSAQEVREKMDALRQRATEPATTPPPAPAAAAV